MVALYPASTFAPLRRPSADDMLVSALFKLTTDDFDLRNLKLAVRIGPADEVNHVREMMQSKVDKDTAAGEAHNYLV
jgi:hypothetical protein